MTEIGEQTISTREQERLRKVYPLFALTFLPFNDYGFESCEVRTAHEGSVHRYQVVNGRVDEAGMRVLHAECRVEETLRGAYPALWCSAHIDQTGVSLSVWVRRGDRDGTAVGQLNLLNVDLHRLLTVWNAQATLAQNDGWFFCTGHQFAEPVHEGQWGYFAARYCKAWGDAHPHDREEAARENYR